MEIEARAPTENRCTHIREKLNLDRQGPTE